VIKPGEKDFTRAATIFFLHGAMLQDENRGVAGWKCRDEGVHVGLMIRRLLSHIDVLILTTGGFVRGFRAKP